MAHRWQKGASPGQGQVTIPTLTCMARDVAAVVKAAALYNAHRKAQNCKGKTAT